MKNIILIRVIILFSLIITIGNTCKAQRGPSKPEVARWKLEKDEKSIWEFSNDGKLYSSYMGSNIVFEYQYSILNTPPICPDATLSIEKNVKYLKLIDNDDGEISCYYIYALNEERFTVMDAVTGHIFPMIKAED